jgi:uncharacterized RDD family membrane protein YckC
MNSLGSDSLSPPTMAEPAAFSTRSGAALIDFVFCSLMAGALGIGIYHQCSYTERDGFAFVAAFLSWSFFWALRDAIGFGASFGKRALSLRVVDASTGAPAGPARLVFRQIFTLSGFPGVNLCIGWVDILIALASAHRTLGDQLMGTCVVSSREIP